MRFVLAFLVGVIFTSSASAVDWRWSFRRLRSPHFDLIYNKDQRALARHFLVAAERAHELVFPYFREGPARTLIVLQDDTDESNGEANFLPYPHIRLYPVLPTASSGLGEYGDWALELMVHEYTHILNMYPAHGFYAPLSYVFGTVIRPNAILPTWYLEGLAVEFESILTDHGRLRARETHASARALTLSDGFAKENISTINEQAMRTWPYGSRPYLYGGWWWRAAAPMKPGSDAIYNLNQSFSRRLPFLLNAPMRAQLGRSASEQLAQAFTEIQARAAREIAQIKTSGAPTPRALLPNIGDQRVFAISPSGRHLVVAQAQPSLPGSVVLRTRARDGQPFAEIEPRVLFRSSGTTQVRWLDDSRFVIDLIDPTRPYVNYRDLSLYDLTTKTKRRLTEGRRAQQPAPSPSGERVAFIRNDGGRNALMVIDVATGKTQNLINGDFTQRLANPEFRGENEILFSLRTRDGHESLRRFDLTTRQISTYAERLGSVESLRRVANGHVLTDAGTGVRNAYLLREGSRDPEAVTNSLTDVSEVDLDPQTHEVVFSELTAEGRRLFALPLATQTPPVVTTDSLPTAPPPPPVKFKLEDFDYQPWRYLLPRFWLPVIYQVENGLIFQGLTGTADPVGRNSYDLMASFDTITRKPSFGFSYQNASLPTRIAVGYNKAQTYLGASGTILEAQSASLTSTQNWPFWTKQASTTFGATWLDTTSSVASYRRAGPLGSFRFSNLESPLGAWHGLQLEARHQEYLPQSGYYAYGRSSVHLSNTARLGAGHHVSLETRGVFSPRLPFANVIVLGERNVGGNYMVNLANSDLMMRGYPSGNFVGRKVINANLEYAFPLIPVDRGWGTAPLFWRSLEVALFVDAIGVDGGAYNRDRRAFERSELGHYFAGTGGELRFNTTVAYHAPLNFTLGLYYGADRTHGGGLAPFASVGFGGLDALKSAAKTP